MLDVSTLQDLISGPGIDTRQWISYGIIQQDTPESHSVRFVDDDGNPLQEGMLVDVKLEPSGLIVTCRVGSPSAGSGESEYSVLGPGDEVLVAIPDGDERAGCVIVCKLPNGSDSFPQTVAGMDVTQNTVSFKRVKTSYIFETGGSYMVRSAVTGASLAIDPIGNVSLTDGLGQILGLSTSGILLQDPTGVATIQIDPKKLQIGMQADTASFLLDKDASVFQSSGTLDVQTAGIAAVGHAVSAEQVAVFAEALMTALGAVIATVVTPPGPAIGAAVTAGAIPIVTAALTAASGLPFGPFQATLTAAMSVPRDPSGSIPAFGIAGLRI